MHDSSLPLRIACAQVAPKVADVVHNRNVSNAAIRAAADADAELVVLPELMQSGYVFHDREEALSVAEGLYGETLLGWFDLARELDIIVVGGFCEYLSPYEVANSAVLIDPRGLISLYRKAHLWDQEKLIFTPGDQPPPVVRTAKGRIGLMICYDLELPEWVRLAALGGAQLLCAPVNWPDLGRPAGERPAEIVRVQAAAAVNRMFIASCDRHGHERGMDWVGGSTIVDADGFPLAGASSNPEDQLLVTDIDLAEADNKWISEYNHVHQDRRPQLYHELCSPGFGTHSSRLTAAPNGLITRLKT
ncbi:nitrilase-related carbon-nitrogen hydrolase [Pseudomonas rubra]|uniref:Carbon-nitrogen hydrolase n=1 Tax=Pseudomonas rubra TaxID=2942627 RepID=A0ABT5P1W6_9PSED|nr:nitrilase-related carbon-nitrogen hydrolase [Pseudomonas rubra]MDD1012267.1 carbon-nitrogen hydrolase [Pseudomonas rubra]MDD1037386.1 carbon-nitrogen hydrolase [Pseudomonas rubra]MDD1153103.1 carbon-nitrogen hydrolase [Pseudomonas rubra]